MEPEAIHAFCRRRTSCSCRSAMRGAPKSREAFGVRPACWRFRWIPRVPKREQAPRTPTASRNRSPRRPSQPAFNWLVMMPLLCFGGLVFVIVLAGHDAEVTKPFGKKDDHDAGGEAEDRPECRDMLNRCVGLVIAHEEDIGQGKQHEAHTPVEHIPAF